MTRAKDDLHLIVPQRFFTQGSRARRPACLRLAHALHPGSLLPLFESVTWPSRLR